MLLQEIKDELAQGPGVYIFYEKDSPLYIGKSTDIKSRILQHFAISNKSRRAPLFTSRADKLVFHLTAGNLGAELREARLIKELYPIYNRMLRRNTTYLAVKLEKDRNGFLYPDIVLRHSTFELSSIKDTYVFPHAGNYKSFLDRLVREHGLCAVKLRLEKRDRCFLSFIGTCKGACSKKQPVEEYNREVLEQFRKYYVAAWPFNGKIDIAESYEDREEIITVENWQVINSKTTGNIDTPLAASTKTSLDEYRILSRHLLS